jgi:hypothetical protein
MCVDNPNFHYIRAPATWDCMHTLQLGARIHERAGGYGVQTPLRLVVKSFLSLIASKKFKYVVYNVLD